MNPVFICLRRVFESRVSRVGGMALFLAMACFGQTHSATLSWTDTANPPGATYNVFRLTGNCPASEPTTTAGFTQLNTTPITSMTYKDTTVVAGQTYCYILTAGVGTIQSASAPSGDAQATVPTLFPPQNLQGSTN
jgi:hypothetical protein